MTIDQAMAFGIIAVTIALFVWGRLPYDLVALSALLAGVAVGIVPARSAFSGLSDDVVVIVASALVVSGAIARSGVVELLMRPLLPFLGTEGRQVPALVLSTTLLSMVTKNVGALAIFMPVAIQLARRTGSSPSKLLMPMSYGALVGGIVTLVGTAPNILVSKIRQDLTGKPFTMFDYTPVGLLLALVGVAFLCVGYRLLPAGRKGASGMEAAFSIEGYQAEARLPPGSPLVGETVAAFEGAGDGDVVVTSVVRERFRRLLPTPGMRLRADDVLLLQGDPDSLERIVSRARLVLAGDAGEAAREGQAVVEGVVTAGSLLAGRALDAVLAVRHGVKLLAVSRSGERIARRLRSVRLHAGDVVVLKGAAATLPETLGTLRVLPLAQRSIVLGRSQRGWLPAAILVAAMASVATGAVPVAMAFFGAAVALMLLRVVSIEDAYRSMEWHVLILLAALIPVSEAVRTTGGTELLARWLEVPLHHVPAEVSLGIMMAAAMLVTPFLNNAAAVLMLGPIAASIAGRLGLSPDPFLMAVAVGCACDFLSPVGHQCNTLVMGPGGYRFGDYVRLGAPLSLLVLFCGTPLIAFFWPLR